MTSRRLIFSGHAVYRMVRRSVTDADVRAVLDAGDIIEDYPNDAPYPSALHFGVVAGRVLHVVAATDAAGNQTIVLTVYEPDPTLWDATLRKRVSP